MKDPARRGLLGFAAGMCSVLPFYQGLWTAIAETGLDWRPYPPGGVPLLLGLAFVGGAIGTVLALLCAGWRGGVFTGAILVVLLWFVIAPLLRTTPTGAGHWVGMLRSGTILLSWGCCIGLGLVLIYGAARTKKH